jgi:hypothetical protein
VSKRKPTRRDLLVVIGRLQNLIGSLDGIANDRNPNRAAQIQAVSRHGMNLCIAATGFEPPVKASGPWAPVGDEDLAWRQAR